MLRSSPTVTSRVAGSGCRSSIRVGITLLNGPVFLTIPSTSSQLGAEDLPPGTDPDPTTIDALAPVAETLRSVTLAATLVGLLVIVAAVVARYRSSSGLDRDRMRWLAWSVIAMTLLSLAQVMFDLERFETLTFFVVVNLAPVAAMTVAVINPRVVAIEELLNRTVVYGVLSVVIVVVDLLALAVLTELLGGSLDQRQVVLLVLLLAAILYNPLRLALWEAGRRLVSGSVTTRTTSWPGWRPPSRPRTRSPSS